MVKYLKPEEPTTDCSESGLELLGLGLRRLSLFVNFAMRDYDRAEWGVCLEYSHPLPQPVALNNPRRCVDCYPCLTYRGSKHLQDLQYCLTKRLPQLRVVLPELRHDKNDLGDLSSSFNFLQHRIRDILIPG